MQNAKYPENEQLRRIEAALEISGTHSLADVAKAIVDGNAQCFENAHGCWITEIMVSPRRKWLNVWVVAGELPGVMDIQPQVLAFAKAHGCEKVTATARLGWKHVAKAHGWSNQSLVITHPV